MNRPVHTVRTACSPTLCVHAERVFERRITVRGEVITTKLPYVTDFHPLPSLEMPKELVRHGSEGTERKPLKMPFIVMPRPRLFVPGRRPQPARRTESTVSNHKQRGPAVVPSRWARYDRERVNVRVMESLR